MAKQRGYIDYLRPALVKRHQKALREIDSASGFSSMIYVAEANALVAVIGAFDEAQTKYAQELAKNKAK